MQSPINSNGMLNAEYGLKLVNDLIICYIKLKFVLETVNNCDNFIIINYAIPICIEIPL